MKFKLLLPALLSISGACLAMEPIEPTHHQSASSAVGTIAADSQCPVCMEQAHTVDTNNLRITACCKNFICQPCENTIQETAARNAAQYQTAAGQIAFGYAPRNQLKASCLLCRKDLKTNPAKLPCTQKPLEIIDANGTQFTLAPELTQALLQCTSLEALELHPGALDFSQLKHKFLTQNMIISLAKTIMSPKDLKKTLDSIEPMAEHVSKLDPKAFEIAHYLGAPDNILYILANELWPYIQEDKTDSESTKTYKKSLRHLARPHLSSPRHFLRYLQSKPANYTNMLRTQFMGGSLLDPQGGIQLDFDSLKVFYSLLRDTGWYTHDNGDWFIKYPFCSLDGIKELLSHIGIKTDSRYSINLSRHKLETFSCDILPDIATLNLSYNNIRTLTGSCLTIANKNYIQSLPYQIILESNPIESIDDSFFEIIRKNRGTAYNTTEISLQNSNLTAAQKKDVRKKFYKATHTVPQRYLNSRIFEGAFLYGGCLAGAAGALYACNKFANYAPQFTKSLSVGLATGIGALIGASREFLSRPAPSGKLMLFDVAAGSICAYVGSKELFNKQPALAKVIPMICAGALGQLSGYFAGWKAGTITANDLAKLSHPEISWNNENWSHGNYSLKL